MKVHEFFMQPVKRFILGRAKRFGRVVGSWRNFSESHLRETVATGRTYLENVIFRLRVIQSRRRNENPDVHAFALKCF